MHQKVLPPPNGLLRVFLYGVLLGLALSSPLAEGARAQSWQPASSQSAEAGELLRYGRQLEVEHRWGEAFSHYEDAVRHFPEDRSLQLRFDNARLHYDLARRYDDRSYHQLLSGLSLSKALELYDEVLVKIQAHHVEGPHWKEFVERGTNMLEVALTEPAFLQLHAPNAGREALDDFRHELRRELGPRLVQSRNDARMAASAAATLAQRRLGVPPPAVALEYTCGAANSLDVYSTYLTPDQLNDVFAQIEGNFVGLGIELKASDGALLIVRVIPESPAERSGILAGDRIIVVDGQSTSDLTTDQAANLLQGVEGSVAELTVVTPGLAPRQVSVRRDRVEVPSIDEAQLLDSNLGIGYLKLICFQKTTCRDLDNALWDLHRQGMKSLIIDLRRNPGGLLVAAVEAADKFLDQGVIVSTRGRSAQEDFTYSAHGIGTWRVPLVVLIDHDSASAAEIFAGAVGYYRRATIVGARSYGKGSVQSIFHLNSSHGGLRLTTSKFYSPGGRAYSQVGVEPDIVVQYRARPVDGSDELPSQGDDDPMLTAALQAAQQLVAQR